MDKRLAMGKKHRKLFLRVHIGYDVLTIITDVIGGNSQFVTYQGDNLGNPQILQKGIPLSETFITDKIFLETRPIH